MPNAGLAVGDAVRVRVLARDVSLALEAPARTSIQNAVPAKVAGIASTDTAMAQVTLSVGGQRLLARVTHRAVSDLGLAPGTPVYALVRTAALTRRG